MTFNSFASWLPAGWLLLGSLALLPLLAVSAPQAQTQRALVFAADLSVATQAKRVAALGGRLVRPGGSGRVLVAEFSQAVSWAALFRNGVVLSLDPLAFGGCFAPNQR